MSLSPKLYQKYGASKNPRSPKLVVHEHKKKTILTKGKWSFFTSCNFYLIFFLIQSTQLKISIKRVMQNQNIILDSSLLTRLEAFFSKVFFCFVSIAVCFFSCCSNFVALLINCTALDCSRLF